VQELSFVSVEAHGWQSAGLTAQLPSPQDAISAALAWKLRRSCLDPSIAATAAAVCASAGISTLSTPDCPGACVAAQTCACCPSNRHASLYPEPSGSAFAAFFNHPDEGLFFPAWPDGVALAARPGLGALGPEDAAVAGQLLRSYQPGQMGGVAGNLGGTG
jgi:hypothetical protein